MDKIISAINKVGRQIFYDPMPLVDYNVLAKKSLAANTYRGFDKIDKTKPGSKEAFERILIDNSKFITESLTVAKTESAIDSLERSICLMLKKELKKNIDDRQLNSYNKLRKPIDIVIEHFVSMGKDFSSSRQNVTNCLFLPLNSPQCFNQTLFLVTMNVLN